jgi:hypothetical protein
VLTALRPIIGDVRAISPALSEGERAEAEQRTAAYWLRQAAVRPHDPGLRLAAARRHAEAAVAWNPDEDRTTLLALARALSTGRDLPVSSPDVRARLAMIHPSVAARLRP